MTKTPTDVRDIPDGSYIFHYHLDEMIHTVYADWNAPATNYLACCNRRIKTRFMHMEYSEPIQHD